MVVIPIETGGNKVDFYAEMQDDGLLLAIVETDNIGSRKSCIAQLDKHQIEELKKVI